MSANTPVIPIDHKRIAPLRSCESCSLRMARHRVSMPGGPTFEVCERCVDGVRL